MCGQVLVKELYHTSRKTWMYLCYGVGGFWKVQVRDFCQVKDILNQTGYHSILQHHVIHPGIRLRDQEFVHMQDDDLKQTYKLCQGHIKPKRNCRSWPAQWADLNPIELEWDEYDRKVRVKQTTSAASPLAILAGILGRSITSLYTVSGGKKAEMEKQWSRLKSAILMNQKIKKIRFVFCFNLYLMWLRKTCI